MSITHNKGNNEMREIKAAGKSTAALLSQVFRTQIVADRATNVNAITYNMILQSASVVEYPEYEVGRAYIKGEIDALYIGYTRFINTMKQEPVFEKLLPLADEVLKAMSHAKIKGKNVHVEKANNRR